jgi:DNA-binding CsgD family transcriptional regulator
VASALLGRASELELLAASVTALRHGRGDVVHLVGEAGIGKTSLLDSTRRDLGSSPATVRSATADETDRQRPLATLRALLPELGPGATTDPVAEAIGAVERLAAAGPVALLADDVHWADDATLVALRALGRRAGRLGVLVLTAARPSVVPGELRRLEELARHDATMIEVAALGADDLDRLAERRIGAPPGSRLRRLLAATAGNPFLADAVLDGLDGTVPNAGGDGAADPDVPDALLDRLAARTLAAVEDGELLLRVLAVVPGGATAEELAETVGRPLGDVLPTALAAVRSAVLVDTGTTLTFRHELLRRAVAGSTPPSIARSLARRAADVLVARQADPARIAGCVVAGSDLADPGDVDRLVGVGMSLRERGPGAAADVLAAALSGLPSRDERATEVTLALGWALVAAGRAGEVDALLSVRFGPSHREESIGVHRLRGIAASLTGRLDAVAATYDGFDVARLEADFDTSDPDVVDAAAELAMLRVSCGQPREAAHVLAWIERSPTPASTFRLATVATVRSQLATIEGRFEDAADLARRALDWARRDLSGRASEAPPSLALAVALDMLGDAAGSLAVSRGRAALSPVPRWGPPLMQFFGALTLFRRGDWDDALAEVDAGLVAADEADFAMAVFWPFSVGALIATARGRPGEAQAWLARVSGDSDRQPLGGEWLIYAMVMGASAAGDDESVVGLIELLVARVSEAGAPAPLLNGGPDLVRIALRAGRADLAKAISYELAALAGRTRSPVAAGIAEWSGGLMDGDPAAVARGAATLAAAGRRPEAARAYHHGAVVAARRGDHELARTSADAALTTYDLLDAAQWRHQLLGELATVGLTMRPRRRVRRPTTGWASLTESEAAIVALVGEGLTNTAIADRQYVSRRTVESHLSRVYAKLSLRTRAELVAAAARR